MRTRCAASPITSQGQAFRSPPIRSTQGTISKWKERRGHPYPRVVRVADPAELEGALVAAASRAVDDGLFALSSGIAASNPRSEHTGDKTSDQTILARQATAPSPIAVLESR